VPGEGRSPNSPADGENEFVTMPVTQHFESHVEIIVKFLERKVATENVADLLGVRVR
jgi:hypothetical protein